MFVHYQVLGAPSPTPRALFDPGPPQSGRSGVRPAQDKTGHTPAPRARPMARRPVRDLRWLVVAVARAEDLSCGGAWCCLSLPAHDSQTRMVWRARSLARVV